MGKTVFKGMVAAMLALSSLPAHAQDTGEDTGVARYSLEKSETGFVRLDRQTGTVTLCKEVDGSLTCRMAADERAAYDEDLARLEKRVDLLEKQLASGTAAAAKGELPSDAEIDRSIGIMERFMRAFFALVQEFRQEEEQTPPSKT
jgi:hypothetical protein